MTIDQIIKRLSANATEFLLNGEKEKANACMDILAIIKETGYKNIKGKII